MNPNPVIFPKLITLYNQDARDYYKFLRKLWMQEEQANELLLIIRNWIEKTNYPVYLNG